MTKKPHGAHLLRESLFALVLLALLVFTVVGEIARFADDVSFETVATATYTYTDTLTGYIFRDEIAPGTLNNGPIEYCVADGTSVRAEEELALVFRDDTGTDKRERAAALYKQIEAYEAALAHTENWQGDFYSAYTALMRELGTDSAAASIAAQALCTALGGKDASKQTVAAQIRLEIEQLRAQLQALTLHTNDPHPVKAEFDGVFYHEADGYEALFGTDAVAALTPAVLTELLRVPASTANSVGKLVGNGTWYFAVPTSTALASTYTCDTVYTLRFDCESVPMLLERITVDETPHTALLIFRAENGTSLPCAARRQAVTVERQSISGLCIPAGAMSKDNTVYVLRDGRALLCPVTPILKENGCLLLAPSTDGSALREGDVVILSERQLFHGKVLE